MDRTEWVNRLELLHVRQRDGQPLTAEEQAWYGSARASLLATAVEVQAQTLATGARPRRSIRITRAAKVELVAGAWSHQSLTLDLGTGGFAVLLETQPPLDDWIRATFHLPGEEPLKTTVSVADVRGEHGLVRVSFTLSEPVEPARTRLETFMLDGILEQLVFWEDVLEKIHA
jgi:hypothetical protein